MRIFLDIFEVSQFCMPAKSPAYTINKKLKGESTAQAVSVMWILGKIFLFLFFFRKEMLALQLIT
jgi:hypothetical protein